MLGGLLVLLAPVAAQPLEGAASPDYWLLTEFDWGDDAAVVLDSVKVAPGFLCFQSMGACKFVRVNVDGEDLLAKFHYRNDLLHRIQFVTPVLDQQQATKHLPRVWATLVAYVQRFQGPADVFGPLPALDAVSAAAPTPTHFWRRPDMDIRIEVARERGGYTVAAGFEQPEALRAPAGGGASD